MPLTDEYVAALQPLSRAFEAYASATGGDYPVLVGGAATAIYTDGQFPSGDFDVVAASDRTFDKAMLGQGFIHENRAGKLRIGYYHPEHPGFGYQQVSGSLFDGLSEKKRLIRVTVTENDAVVLPAIEDMIADRLAQHAVSSPTDDSRLRQAKALLSWRQLLICHIFSAALATNRATQRCWGCGNHRAGHEDDLTGHPPAASEHPQGGARHA